MPFFDIKAIVRGASHVASNIKCQDNYSILKLDENFIVVAVADGHGSSKCKYSRNGSDIAANCFCGLIKEIYKDSKGNHESIIRTIRNKSSIAISKRIVDDWNERIKLSYDAILENNQKKKNDKEEIPEFSKELFGTTLLGLIIADEFIYAIQFGDGDISFVNNQNVSSVIEADKFLGTETFSLSNEEAWKHAKEHFQRINIDELKPFMIMVTTDGFANSFVDDEQYKISCKEYLKTIIDYGVDSVQDNLTQWLSETSSEGCGDDITLVAVGSL